MFARRFADQPDEGYAYLERILHGRDPSFGYSVLAQVLANTRHRVVITTNFDNLVADALAIYTDKLPFVCGHESLAGFVRINPRRPLVIKVHRDLLLAPKNRVEELAALPEALVQSLRDLLRSYTPIVIGYGGNDGSLMGLLRDTPLVFHCHHGGRSQQAAEYFLDQGFTRVANLRGGIEAWSVEVDPQVPRY